MSSTYDVFLVLHPFRQNVAEFQILVRPLTDLQRRYLLGAEGFYCDELDTALLVLRFPEKVVQRWGTKLVHMFAARTGLPMVVPSELPPRARRKFFLEHVSKYNVYVQQYPDKDARMPLAVRVLEFLAGHLEDTPAPELRERFDAERDLPVYGKKTNYGRRATSVGA